MLLLSHLSVGALNIAPANWPGSRIADAAVATATVPRSQYALLWVELLDRNPVMVRDTASGICAAAYILF